MKKEQKLQRKSLRVHSEKIRELDLAQLTDVAGGTNGCISHNTGPSACNFCQN